MIVYHRTQIKSQQNTNRLELDLTTRIKRKFVRKSRVFILSNPKTDVYIDVSIRGTKGRVYHCKETNRVVAIHTEGEFAGQIMKAQLVSDPQVDSLRRLKTLD